MITNFFLNSLSRPKRAGFSLVEVMIAGAILGGMALAMASLFTQQNNQILGLRLVSSRDSLRNLSDKYVADSAAIAMSIDQRLPLKFLNATQLGNQLLDRCLNGNGTATSCPTGATGTFPACCIAKDGAGSPLYQDFSLVDPGDPAVSGKKAFSGTNANPLRYNVDGAACSLVSSRCILELVTSFVATCASSAASCAQATGVSTRYEIRLAAGFTPPAGPVLRNIKSNPVVTGGGGGGGLLTQNNCYWTGFYDWQTGPVICSAGYYLAGHQQRDCGNWHECDRFYCCQGP